MTYETGKDTIHLNRMLIMYSYTILTAGISGLAFLIAPNATLALLGAPPEEPIFAGVVYSVWFAFGVVSMAGLRSPLKYAPIFLLQLIYKLTWFGVVVVPQLLVGNLSSFAMLLSVLFASIIIGDLVVIPWRYLFSE